MTVVGEGVPGVWDTVGGWEGYTGYYRVPTQHAPRTHISHIPALRPYLRPNEGYFEVFMRFLRLGLRQGPELTRIDPESTRIDPSRLVPRWSRDDLQMTLQTSYPGPSQTAVSE